MEYVLLDHSKHKLLSPDNTLIPDKLYEYLLNDGDPDVYISQDAFNRDTLSDLLKDYFNKYPDRPVSITGLAMFNIYDIVEDDEVLIYLNAVHAELPIDEYQYLDSSPFDETFTYDFIDPSPVASLNHFMTFGDPEDLMIRYVKLNGSLNMKEFDQNDSDQDLLIYAMRQGYVKLIDAILDSPEFNSTDFDYISFAGLDGEIIKKLYDWGIKTTSYLSVYESITRDIIVDENLKLGLFYSYLAGADFDVVYEDMLTFIDETDDTRADLEIVWTSIEDFDELFQAIRSYSNGGSLLVASLTSITENKVDISKLPSALRDI